MCLWHGFQMIRVFVWYWCSWGSKSGDDLNVSEYVMSMMPQEVTVEPLGCRLLHNTKELALFPEAEAGDKERLCWVGGCSMCGTMFLRKRQRKEQQGAFSFQLIAEELICLPCLLRDRGLFCKDAQNPRSMSVCKTGLTLWRRSPLNMVFYLLSCIVL